ncbi:MAG: xanthine dehydrogenase family protein molybdopterin-binding subunit [Chloroflexi bacterium]|nr:MAG: xanthine dehydrogenase family protein molybdopterin-binding subunit [Chloroflexota bacterium]MBL1196105.1 xanthine dehydrogenase family protein molybdopterin-binding subunit [Chloroflexota bacterium]NOH13398.1 xanthine dehydrogenase family protein molybdopterin-binding subunit [Chloroflexota bacterium]
MTTKFFGKRIKRNEDPRLLTGQALFVDDVNLPGMLHVAFVRSPYAHARITGIDVSKAKEREGVVAVYTADDLGNYWGHGPLLVSPPPVEGAVFNERTQPFLAKDKVCHVSEGIVAIVAESRYIAEDAVGDVIVNYEPLPANVDPVKSLEESEALIHEDLEQNLAAHIIQQKGEYEKAKADADVIISREFWYDRGTAAAMENRGVVAEWDNRSQKMTIWDTTQAPVVIRNGMAGMLGLSENQVRVVAPFIGGGFGPKIMMFYPEEVIIPWVAMQLNRPVKWIEDRSENFYTTTQERGQWHESEMALTKDGKILGVSDVFWHDNGAYDPYGLTVPLNTQCTLLGMYDVPNYYTEFKAVFTNKPIVTPYRGAGRQHGVFVMERLLDFAAKELGIDKTEIRRINMLQPDQFPHNHKIIFQDFTELTYDSGNYEPILDKTIEGIGYKEFYEEMKPKAEAEGKRLGLGLVCYVEGTGIGPYEGARVTVNANGKVSVATGVGTQGQGHFTSFAQIVAEQLGVAVEDIDLSTGDTDQFRWGVGTFASRGATVAGSAINEAAAGVRKKILKIASDQLEAAEEDLELVDGTVQVKGVPAKAIPLGELANLANPLRGAVKPGTEPGLESTDYFGPEMGATASGAQAMIVEIDPDTMMIEIKKYLTVHDCGEVINPLILDGQVHGGIAQGIGNAFYEELVFDDNGQILNASFMDYLLPTSLDVPHIDVDHQVTPSPLNPLGIKGAGEAGAIPVGPLFAQAFEDAFSDIGLEIRDIPLNPHKLWELVEEAKAKQA